MEVEKEEIQKLKLKMSPHDKFRIHIFNVWTPLSHKFRLHCRLLA